MGLGALGVVTEVTIKCVERHKLLESTSVMTRAEVKRNHQSLLQNNKHIRQASGRIKHAYKYRDTSLT